MGVPERLRVMDAPRSGSVVESLLSDTSSSDAAKQCQVQSFCCSARTESSGRGGAPERHVECWQPQKQRLLRETEGVPLVHVENHRFVGEELKAPFPAIWGSGCLRTCFPPHLLIPDISAPSPSTPPPRKSSRSMECSYSTFVLFPSSPDSGY